MTRFLLPLAALALLGCNDDDANIAGEGFSVPDTNQELCYDVHNQVTDCAGTGQDGEYETLPPWYTDHEDGTVTDGVTGLMWQQGMDDKTHFYAGEDYCADLDVGGYDDWRVPTIKELYSLMDFSGATGTGDQSSGEVPDDAVPYIDTETFDFAYGDESAGERFIDAQWFSSNVYLGEVMGGQECAFGVNHADGRIKCYPTSEQPAGGFYFRCVRGHTDYGTNDFADHGDGTVTDQATELMWMQEDSGTLGAGDLADGTMDWLDALSFCEDLTYAEHDDWRLPDAKELQSIVDYDRSPDSTDSAALDPIFSISEITNELGDKDWPWFWTSTTHLDGMEGRAAYVAFGRAIGQMEGETMDVHGAGAQRSDPKTGDREDYPQLGQGPQGDSQRVFNHVRCVR